MTIILLPLYFLAFLINYNKFIDLIKRIKVEFFIQTIEGSCPISQ